MPDSLKYLHDLLIDHVQFYSNQLKKIVLARSRKVLSSKVCKRGF